MKVRPSVRQVLVAGAIFLITLSLGGELLPALSTGNVSVQGIGLLVVILLARTLGSGSLARALSPPSLAPEGALAGGFKNIALSAGVAAAALRGSAAALPSLLAFPIEACYFMLLARHSGGRPDAGARRAAGSTGPATKERGDGWRMRARRPT